MTSFRELSGMVSDPSAETRAFGMAALAFTVGTMQRGSYVRVSETTLRDTRRAVGAVCAAHLGEADIDIHEDVHASEWTCHALWLSQLEGAAGVGDAAAAAIRTMDAHGGGNGREGGCQRLAERDKTVAPLVVPLPRGIEGESERCLTASFKPEPSLMLCLETNAASALTLAYRDTSGLDPKTERHILVAATPFALGAGVRIEFHESDWHDLGRSGALHPGGPGGALAAGRLTARNLKRADSRRSALAVPTRASDVLRGLRDAIFRPTFARLLDPHGAPFDRSASHRWAWFNRMSLMPTLTASEFKAWVLISV